LKRLLVPLAAVLGVLLVLWSLRDDGGPAEEEALGPELPRYVLRGAEWSRFDEKGRLEFQGSADTIDYFDDESARMRTFALSVFGREGAPWSATAPEGYAPPGGNQQRLQLRGGVEGRGRWPDGEDLEFRTPELWVDTKAETLSTDAKVMLDSRSRNAVARGLRVAGPQQHLSLLHDVEMRYVPR
jgi:LPS export ABC transporter protein LptC